MNIKFQIEVKEDVPFAVPKFIHYYDTCSTTQVSLIE
jgi:hypothetical protein